MELAARALGCEESRIAKTLAFLVGEKAILIVAAGDAKVDNPKYKARFGTKAKMLTPDQTVEMVGHAVGGVCPLPCAPGWRSIWTGRWSGLPPCSRLRQQQQRH